MGGHENACEHENERRKQRRKRVYMSSAEGWLVTRRIEG
jgi:hypothetical protein